MTRLLRSLRFRNERHFDRARADLLRCVHPEESVPALLPMPGDASASSSSFTWADAAPAVAAATYDRPADRELVMAAALALDKKLAFLSLGPHSEVETRALLASTHGGGGGGGGGGQPQPLLAVDATAHGAGLGVFAARDIEAGTVVTEYAGTTLVGADAAALRTAADEWSVVWEEAKAADGSSGGGGGGGEAMGAKAFGGAVQERYRKLHGFESLGREGGVPDGGRDPGGEVGPSGAEAVLIFGDSWTPGSGTGNLAGCGAIVNDGAALMAAVLGASEGEGVPGIIHADLTAACEAYQRESLERATVAMVPRGSAMFAVANRDVCAGEELCFPYGSSWWFGHAREALLDEIAVLLYQQETSQSNGSSGSGGSGSSGGSSSSGRPSNAAGDGEQCETMIDMLAAMEAASAATIQGERRLLGLTGGYERAGVAPLPGLPRGSPTTPPLLEFRLYERVVRLRYEVGGIRWKGGGGRDFGVFVGFTVGGRVITLFWGGVLPYLTHCAPPSFSPQGMGSRCPDCPLRAGSRTSPLLKWPFVCRGCRSCRHRTSFKSGGSGWMRLWG